MAKQQPWTTWEELLLACAVNRHGTESWTSVANEIQKRNCTLTASECRHKYKNLKQRFESSDDDVTVPWLDELRKLRVDELKCELEHYDLSISLLQSKVKRLEDEREKSLQVPDPVKENLNRVVDPVNEEPDSCRGSCETVREGDDETSDVQSSRKIEDNDDQSLTVDNILIKSQPLIDFIEILQSHPIGSRFARRLQNQWQERSEYKKIIKQHVDFEMIRSRVEEGYYGSFKSLFFRDLLLLINNASVFYGEFSSAKQLYQLIKKQMMSLKNPKRISTVKDESLVMTKEDVATVSLAPVSLKPEMSVPIVVCRKRSSLAGRSSMSVNEPLKKRTKVVPVVDEKEVSAEEDETSDKDDEPIGSKKMAKGRTASTAKKVGGKNIKTSSNAGLSSKGRSSNDNSEPKKSDQEKKGNNTNGGSKKQSVATFLKRMKGVSSSDIVAETVKGDSSNGKRGVEQRRSNSKNDKVDARKPHAGQKRSTEKGSPAKKNTGTASKKGTSPSFPVVKKRGSEASEKEAGSSEAGSSAHLKKRSRRL